MGVAYPSFAYIRPFPGYPAQAQREAAREFHARHLARLGFTEPAFFEDAGSHRVSLSSSPVGSRLVVRMDRGDALIVPCAAAAFRDFQDLAASVDAWSSRGVHVHLLDVASVPASPSEWGRMLVTVLRAVESFMHRQAQNAGILAAQKRRAGGKAMNQHSGGVGFMLTGPRRARRIVPCPAEQRVMQRIVAMRRQGLPLERIALTLMKDRVRDRHGSTNWCVSKVERFHEAAERLFGDQEKEIQNVG